MRNSQLIVLTIWKHYILTYWPHNWHWHNWQAKMDVPQPRISLHCSWQREARQRQQSYQVSTHVPLPCKAKTLTTTCVVWAKQHKAKIKQMLYLSASSEGKGGQQEEATLSHDDLLCPSSELTVHHPLLSLQGSGAAAKWETPQCKGHSLMRKQNLWEQSLHSVSPRHS